jgi:hypothetical protein
MVVSKIGMKWRLEEVPESDEEGEEARDQDVMMTESDSRRTSTVSQEVINAVVDEINVEFATEQSQKTAAPIYELIKINKRREGAQGPRAPLEIVIEKSMEFYKKGVKKPAIPQRFYNMNWRKDVEWDKSVPRLLQNANQKFRCIVHVKNTNDYVEITNVIETMEEERKKKVNEEAQKTVEDNAQSWDQATKEVGIAMDVPEETTEEKARRLFRGKGGGTPDTFRRRDQEDWAKIHDGRSSVMSNTTQVSGQRPTSSQKENEGPGGRKASNSEGVRKPFVPQGKGNQPGAPNTKFAGPGFGKEKGRRSDEGKEPDPRYHDRRSPKRALVSEDVDPVEMKRMLVSAMEKIEGMEKKLEEGGRRKTKDEGSQSHSVSERASRGTGRNREESARPRSKSRPQPLIRASSTFRTKQPQKYDLSKIDLIGKKDSGARMTREEWTEWRVQMEERYPGLWEGNHQSVVKEKQDRDAVKARLQHRNVRPRRYMSPRRENTGRIERPQGQQQKEGGGITPDMSSLQIQEGQGQLRQASLPVQQQMRQRKFDSPERVSWNRGMPDNSNEDWMSQWSEVWNRGQGTQQVQPNVMQPSVMLQQHTVPAQMMQGQQSYGDENWKQISLTQQPQGGSWQQQVPMQPQMVQGQGSTAIASSQPATSSGRQEVSMLMTQEQLREQLEAWNQFQKFREWQESRK